MNAAEFRAFAERVELTRRYLEIESLRLGDRLQVAWRLPEPLPQVAVPTLVLQCDATKYLFNAGEGTTRSSAQRRSSNARVEHVFAVTKRLWGFDKVRYRGLAKNATRAFVAVALDNLYSAHKRLVA